MNDNRWSNLKKSLYDDYLATNEVIRETTPEPDLDFDKYGEQLKKLGVELILGHVKYWRQRCLILETAASKAVEEWHAFGYNGDEMTECMDALAELLND